MSGTTADGAKLGVVYISFWDTPTHRCDWGSGIMLTNKWLMTAAHVFTTEDPLTGKAVWGPCGGIALDHMIVSMKSTPFDQSQYYGAAEIPAIYVHPKFVPPNPLPSKGTDNHGWDAA